MASEIRVNTINNRSGFGTISITDSGAVFSGVTTSSGGFSGNVTGNVTGNLTGDVNAGVVTATSSIVVGNSFINATSIGIGTTTTAGRNAGVGTATGTLVYDADVGLLVFSGTVW